LQNQRNLLLAVALSFALLIGWDTAMSYFYPAPPEAEESETAQAETPQAAAGGAAEGAGAPSGASSGTAAGASSGVGAGAAGASAATGAIDGANPAAPADLETALTQPQRLRIEAPRLSGSINLLTGSIDDIELKDYNETTQSDSELVRIFAPQGTPDQHFARFGFLVNGTDPQAGGPWVADGEALTPETPITLTRASSSGITAAISLSIDENFMITAEQTVSNAGPVSEDGAVPGDAAAAGPAALVQPYAFVRRSSNNATADEFIVHAGMVGVFGGTLNDEYGYDDMPESGKVSPDGDAAWLGFTDRYWLSALIPGQAGASSGAIAEASWRALGDDLYNSELRYDAVTLPVGQSHSQTTQLFVGAKESKVLDQYADSGIDKFGLAISWGWFRFLEKPLLWVLKNVFELVGNFGVAIIILTMIVRGLLFPIAQKQFASMAAMKAIQPEMKAIQERNKDDKVKAQQEMQKLFKDKKVNPLAGCLPILLQIPIFFALYKVLYLAIEMRHQSFLWVSDLSSPDPAKILNLFGLLPFDPPSFLGIGVLAIGLGVTMWLTFKMNPAAMDPVQQQIFNIMPWVLMFVMAPFAAGLLLYWNTSNILTLAQQWYLYSKHPQLRAAAEKEKAEKAAKVAKEKAEKGG
jgi:YidC/Oxa1 family membrane protein insertase